MCGGLGEIYVATTSPATRMTLDIFASDPEASNSPPASKAPAPTQRGPRPSLALPPFARRGLCTLARTLRPLWTKRTTSSMTKVGDRPSHGRYALTATSGHISKLLFDRKGGTLSRSPRCLGMRRVLTSTWGWRRSYIRSTMTMRTSWRTVVSSFTRFVWLPYLVCMLDVSHLWSVLFATFTDTSAAPCKRTTMPERGNASQLTYWHTLKLKARSLCHSHSP